MTENQEKRLYGYILFCTGMAIYGSTEGKYGVSVMFVALVQWALAWWEGRPRKREKRDKPISWRSE